MDLEKQTLDIIRSGEKCIGTSDKSVLFLGLAGNGKTTLIKWFLNLSCRMKILGDGWRKYIRAKDIGADTHNSTTKIPHCYEEDGIRYYDCPGFRGTQGAAHRLATSYFIKTILDASKQVKFVLVVDHYTSHRDLVELLEYVSSFIKDVEKFSKSILFVSTEYISDNVSCEKSNCSGLYTCEKCDCRPSALYRFKQTLEELWKELNRYNVDLGDEIPFGLSRDRLKIITALLGPNKYGLEPVRSTDHPRSRSRTLAVDEDSYCKARANVVWKAIENLQFCQVEPNDFCYGLSGLEEIEVVRLIEDSSETVCEGIKSLNEPVSTFFDKITEASQSFHLLTKKINRNCDALKRMKEDLVRTKTVEEFVSSLSTELGLIGSVELNKARENLLEKLNWFRIWLNYLPAGNHEKLCRKLTDCVCKAEKSCYNHKLWCITLKHIHDEYCSYDRQLERYKYDVSEISEWGRGKLHDQEESSLLRINANNVHRFLSIVLSRSMGDEQQLPPAEFMTERRIDHLKHLIHVTIKSANKIHFCNGVLSVQGNFIRSILVSDKVNQLLQEGSSVISIRVEALHTIYIDSNFELEACQLTLIAPHIETIGGRKITLIASTGDSNPSSFLCVTRTLQGSLQVTGTNGLESHEERTGVSVTDDEPTRKVYGEPLIEPKTGCNSIFLCRRVKLMTPNIIQDAPDLISLVNESYSFYNTDRMYKGTSSAERGQGNATSDIRSEFAKIITDYKMNILKHLNDFWLGEPLQRFVEDTLCHDELDSLYSYTSLREEFEYLNQNNSMHQDQIRLLSFYKALSKRIERLNAEDNEEQSNDCNRQAMDSLQNDLKLVMEDMEQSIVRRFTIDIPGYFESQLSKVMDFNQLKSTLKSLEVKTSSGDRIQLKINDLISSKKQIFDSDLQATYQTAEYLRLLDSEDLANELP